MRRTARLSASRPESQSRGPSADFDDDVHVDEAHEAVVIGAGISGLATLKALLDAGINAVCLEATDRVGGLWTYREDRYSVAAHTTINVSKQNYSFSTHQFPDDAPNFVHHSTMSKYIADFSAEFQGNIRFNTSVVSLKQGPPGENGAPSWLLTVSVDGSSKTAVYLTSYVAVATGHHASPNKVSFPGQERFTGETMHSVAYKDGKKQGIVGKRVVVVGIGNSAVDVAENCVTNDCDVIVSTRSGAWVVPNYLFGTPTDHYANRLFMALPWKLATGVFETLISLVSGHPTKWGLNPRMRALQSQPTVSATLIHRIQRGQVRILPNIQEFEGGRVVRFADGSTAEADVVIFCTGYNIDLPFLAPSLRSKILDPVHNTISLYENVFHEDIGHSLAFIGFVQPASGGLLSISEIQGRWFAELIRGRVKLPDKRHMVAHTRKENQAVAQRYTGSRRHTIQRDPLVYCDRVASYIGAKPSVWANPSLAYQLWFSTCGSAQWRLQGPGRWEHARSVVASVPATGLMKVTAICLLLFVVGLVTVLGLWAFWKLGFKGPF